jgi:hypothetical protein
MQVLYITGSTEFYYLTLGIDPRKKHHKNLILNRTGYRGVERRRNGKIITYGGPYVVGKTSTYLDENDKY